MPEYATKHDLAKMFKCKELTIQRWIDEEKAIRFDGKAYLPVKTPGGHWRFKITMSNNAKL